MAPVTNKFDPDMVRERLLSMICSDVSSFVTEQLLSFLRSETLPHRKVSGTAFLEDHVIQVTHDAEEWISAIKSAWEADGLQAPVHRKPFLFFGALAVVLCARLRRIADFRDIDEAQYGQGALKRLLKCLRGEEDAAPPEESRRKRRRRRPTVDSFLQNLLGTAAEPPKPNDRDDDSDDDTAIAEPVAAVLSFLYEQEASLRRRLSVPSIEYLGVGSWLRILQRSSDVRQVIVPAAEKLLLKFFPAALLTPTIVPRNQPYAFVGSSYLYKTRL